MVDNGRRLYERVDNMTEAVPFDEWLRSRTGTARRGDSQSGIGFTANEAFTRFSCLRQCSGNGSVLLPER